MNIKQNQLDMSKAYIGGAPGVFISGLAWLTAGLTWHLHGMRWGFAVLVIAGMLIFPLSILVSRTVFRAPKVTGGNPLNRLALESTFGLMAAILLGYVLLVRQPLLAFPAVALIMGTRYFIFRTLYGAVTYWGLGAIVCGLGAMSVLGVPLPVGNLALQIGVAELIMAMVIFVLYFSSKSPKNSDE